MRGKDALIYPCLYESRITPAYAGKRLSYVTYMQVKQDHPRVCGEKLIKRNFFNITFRITPAYAGKRVKYDVFIV